MSSRRPPVPRYHSYVNEAEQEAAPHQTSPREKKAAAKSREKDVSIRRGPGDHQRGAGRDDLAELSLEDRVDASQLQEEETLACSPEEWAEQPLEAVSPQAEAELLPLVHRPQRQPHRRAPELLSVREGKLSCRPLASSYAPQLDEGERRAREQLILDVTEAIQAKWPGCIVNVFGSYPAGLSTFLSDIDISLLGMGIEDPNSAELEVLMCSAPEGEVEESNTDNLTEKSLEEEDDGTPWEIDFGRGADGMNTEEVSWAIDRMASTTVVSDSETSEAGLDSAAVSLSDSDSDAPKVLPRKRKRVQEIEEDLSFNITSKDVHRDGAGHTRRRNGNEIRRSDILENKQRQTALLQTLFAHLRAMDWMSEGEFRHKAKVPIIYMTHRSGVGCDVSLGVTAQDTSALVSQLKAIDADAFVVVSNFLKVFLHLLALDKPFSGGYSKIVCI